MDWIMEFRFMIYLFSELLLRIHRAPRPAQVLGCKGGRDPVRWQGVHCLRAEVDQRGMVEEAGEVGGFLEEAASKLSLEGYVGICWEKGEGRREERCRYIPKRGNSTRKGKVHLPCTFRDTRDDIHTSQVIFKT